MILLRKVVIVVLAVFVQDSFFQVFICAIAIVGFLVAHIVVRPFTMSDATSKSSRAWLLLMFKYRTRPTLDDAKAWDEMNFLESLSLSTTFVTMMGCAYPFAGDVLFPGCAGLAQAVPA